LTSQVQPAVLDDAIIVIRDPVVPKMANSLDIEAQKTTHQLVYMRGSQLISDAALQAHLSSKSPPG
jgi:hypothetical protein